MKKLLLMFVGLFILATAAYAAPVAPILDVSSHLPRSKPIVEMEDAIINAAKEIGWQTRIIAQGHIEATIYVRAHTAKATILYTSEGYEIKYLDSYNLKYDPTKGTIHRNYNKWIQKLNSRIYRKL